MNDYRFTPIDKIQDKVLSNFFYNPLRVRDFYLKKKLSDYYFSKLLPDFFYKNHLPNNYYPYVFATRFSITLIIFVTGYFYVVLK